MANEATPFNGPTGNNFTLWLDLHRAQLHAQCHFSFGWRSLWIQHRHRIQTPVRSCSDQVRRRIVHCIDLHSQVDGVHGIWLTTVPKPDRPVPTSCDTYILLIVKVHRTHRRVMLSDHLRLVRCKVMQFHNVVTPSTEERILPAEATCQNRSVVLKDSLWRKLAGRRAVLTDIPHANRLVPGRGGQEGLILLRDRKPR